MIDGRCDGSLDCSLNFDAVGDLLCDGAFGGKSEKAGLMAPSIYVWIDDLMEGWTELSLE
jgi:hypothetical protein